MLLAETLPYNDPGSLFGGVRQRIIDMQRIQADLLREASQSQSVIQNGRAFSGAQVINDQNQTATLEQNAVAENNKDVTVNDADADLGDVPAGFHFNYLERLLSQVKAQDFLARSILNLNQSQRVVQTGFSSGLAFQGNPSTVINNLNQDETVNQTGDSTVTANVNARRDPETTVSARFRETEVDMQGARVEAGTFAVQDQGRSLEDASMQVARSDGGVTVNNLNQNLSGSQHNNVDMQNTVDVSVDGAEELTPRSSSTTVRIEGDTVRNHGSAVQTQALVQIAEGGVDENGNPTENGGTSINNAVITASFEDISSSKSTTNVMA